MTEGMHIIDEDAYDGTNDFKQVNIGDSVDMMWGYEELTLTEENISHLRKGGFLYHSDGEYATLIALKENHGEWIEEGPIKVYCSFCGWVSYSMLCENNSVMMRNNKTPYCPNCGAKMDARAGVFE